MSHHKLRNDNECQNCGYTVDVAYCSKCGQQNTETRQSFHHLLTHFAEDLTHYDGAFWKTIKYLLFRPGRLTIEYLLGHRMRYVPPVKLYIFISFVTFFLMAIMAPDAEHDHKIADTNVDTELTLSEDGIKYETETHDNSTKIEKGIEIGNKRIYTVTQLDSVQNALSDKNKMPFYEYYSNKVALKIGENNLSKRDLMIAAAHTLPKVLFIYMPIFAFWLWLMHGKKRWYFFDHGIFTLHYFSFLLLSITIIMVINWLLSYAFSIDANTFVNIIRLLFLLYAFFYFFRSHRRFYGETRAISRIKSTVLFIINFICIAIICVVTLMYIVLNMH